MDNVKLARPAGIDRHQLSIAVSGAPGIRDVAEVAGVSPQTVSRVLNSHPSVKAGTKARVELAINQLGYQRNYAARSLSTGRTRIIGVVMLNTNYYSRSIVMNSIESAAAAADYSVISSPVESMETFAIETSLRRLVERGADGIILAVPLIQSSPAISQLTDSIPTVTLDGSRTVTSELLAIDQALVAEIATEHLLGLGHETVWHVSGPQSWIEALSRSQGWRSTLTRAGRYIPPEFFGDWSPESGYRNGLIAARVPELTAIFVSSDEMAFGVMRALHEGGRQVPDDVSVVGVDNIALAEYSSPSLTTVAQPFDAIGSASVARLLDRLQDTSEPLGLVGMEPRLIVRGSTAAPKE